jgi:hypothetical protein
MKHYQTTLAQCKIPLTANVLLRYGNPYQEHADDSIAATESTPVPSRWSESARRVNVNATQASASDPSSLNVARRRASDMRPIICVSSRRRESFRKCAKRETTTCG